MPRRLSERDAAVLADALSAPSAPLPGRPGQRIVVVTTVAIEPGPDSGLVGTAQLWVRPPGRGARRVGDHVVALNRGPELEVTAIRLSAPEEVAGAVVGHALVRLAAGDVARVRARGTPPGGHRAWAEVMGWDRAAAEHNRAELALAVARGCQAFLDEGRPAGEVVALEAELRRAIRVGVIDSLRRPELAGDPGGRQAPVPRFWRRVLAQVSPADLAAMGPVVDGSEHLGAWVLRRGEADWAGVLEFTELGARLARAMRRADLNPGLGHGLDPGPIGA